MAKAPPPPKSLLFLQLSVLVVIMSVFFFSLNNAAEEEEELKLPLSPAEPPKPHGGHHHHHHHNHHPDPLHHHIHHHSPVYPPAKSPVSHIHPPPAKSPVSHIHPPAKSPVLPVHPPAKSPVHPVHPPPAKSPVHFVHPPAKSPVYHVHPHPPVKAPAKPPVHLGHPPVKGPVHPPFVRNYIAVQGVVFCKSCKYPGIDTLWGATALSGSKVKLECNNTKYRPVTETAITDKNGYFLISPKGVTTAAFHKCRVFLLSSPSSSTCNIPTNFHYGITGATLKPATDKPPVPTPDHHLIQLFTVGPFAFEPSKKFPCPKY